MPATKRFAGMARSYTCKIMVVFNPDNPLEPGAIVGAQFIARSSLSIAR